MPKEFRVRDPVHHFIKLNEEEVAVVGTQVFQRLRGIRQLAMANLVYPGALHTRFEHSLGVCHLAGLLSEQLGLSEDERRLIRLAGLLHDLGHGPFSHVSEYALDLYADRNTLPSECKEEKIHEVVTGKLICSDPEILRIVGESKCEKIAKLLAEGHGPNALRAIVSGPLDSDKQDYLLRDSYFCGVPYGIFDIHQFHRSLVLGGEGENQELMILPDGIHAVEQYALAKYYMTTNVYRHRVRLITDQMLIRAIRLGIEEDNIEELKSLYSFDNSAEFYENYRRWNDSRFLLTFGNQIGNTTLCGQLIDRLQSRELLKMVFFSRDIRDFDDETKEVIQAINKKENAELRKRLEEEIASLIKEKTAQPVEQRFVIVNAFDIKSVRTTSRNDEAHILVKEKPVPKPFEQASSLFASIDARYSDMFVEVYAPVKWDTRREKEEILSGLRQPIFELLEKVSKEARK